MKLVIVLIFLFAGTLHAQWPALGSSEDSLIANIGKPDSSNNSNDYFHCRFLGVDGLLIVCKNDDGIIQYRCWQNTHTTPDDVKIVASIAEDIQSSAIDKFSTYGEDNFRVWTNQDSVELLTDQDSIVQYIAMSREYYYPAVDSESLTDSFFTISGTAFPLDSESTHIVKAWKTFLELPCWNCNKFLLWSRYDKLMYNYFRVPGCPDFSTDGYKAKLIDIVKDPELNTYTLSTVYSPSDTTNPEFPSWKRTSRQMTYFRKEDGAWKITTALPFVAYGWKAQSVGSIVYHFPQNHTFDSSRARRATQFIDSVSTLFNVPTVKYLDYYYAFGGLCTDQLLGLDVLDFHTGIFLRNEPIILLTDTVEDNRHELVHAALSSLPRDAIMSEGIATFLANDSATDSALVVNANQFYKSSKDFSLDNFNSSDSTNFLPYTFGLILFQNVYASGGMNAVVAFYKASIDRPTFDMALKKYLKTDLGGLDNYLRKEVEKAAEALHPKSEK